MFDGVVGDTPVALSGIVLDNPTAEEWLIDGQFWLVAAALVVLHTYD